MRKQVVRTFSGARYFGEPYKVPDSDHFSIAKVDGPMAIQHRLLRQFILEFSDCEASTEKRDGSVAMSLPEIIVAGPGKREHGKSPAYLFYMSSDRIANLFHQIDSETLERVGARKYDFLPFGEPGASSTQDRSRRALVNQLGAVVEHLSRQSRVDDLKEVVRSKGTLDADWYFVETSFQPGEWQKESPILTLSGAVDNFTLELSCTKRNFCSIIEESGNLLPTSTSEILFRQSYNLPLAGLVRLAAVDKEAMTLRGTALFLVLQPLRLAL